MKKGILLLLSFVFVINLFSQEKLYIHKSDKITLGALVAKTDSIYFNAERTMIYFQIGDIIAQYDKTVIDSMVFGNNDTTVYINYSGTTASVLNPLAFEGVSVAVNGADVTVTQTGEIRDISYVLSGTTTEGMFKIYSEKRFNLMLNSVNITNTNGPAINIQSENKVFVKLADGTTNTLTDGPTYASAVIKPNGNAEDQNATFFSEGKLVFTGNGSLAINGKGSEQHGLNSDETIEFESGTINIASAPKDGIHGKEGIKILGGIIDVKASGEAIDGGGGYMNISGGTVTTTTTIADTKGISCDSVLNISGGTITVNVGGVQSKGLKAGQNITLSGGNIAINTTGGAALITSGSGYDPSYCKAISSDSNVYISGATLKIVSSGIAGKGISANGSVIISSGSVNITCSGNGSTYTTSTGTYDSYFSSCISTDKNIVITGGTLIATNTGTAGKGLSAGQNLIIGDANGSPIVNSYANGNGILVSGSGQNADYSIAKALKGSVSVTINSGTITATATGTTRGGEGVESPSITFNGGSTSISAYNDGVNGSYGTVVNGTESNDGSIINFKGGYVYINSSASDAIDGNGNILMTGGTVVANGPSSGVEEAADFNGTFNVNGGFFIGAGSNSSMTKALSTTSTQRNYYISSTAIISSSSLLHIQDANGVDILTFKPANGAYKFLFSSPSLTTGINYSIYTGGSYSGGTTLNGLSTGGTYSTTGAALKKTASLTTTSTLNSVSF
jgi:hypothetical protein